MLKKSDRKKILYMLFVLLITVGLSVGFSAFQKNLKVEDLLMHVRLQRETRVSNKTIQSANNATSNVEDYNVSKIYGNVTFDSTSGYILYKVSLTNYGNVKTGLLKIDNHSSGLNYQLCDSNGNNCTNDVRTAICDGSNCTLGASKDVYVKVSSSSTGAKNVDMDLDFEPYNDITYDNFNENTNNFKKEIMSTDSYEVTFTSRPEEVEVSGTAEVSYNKSTGKLSITNVGSNLTISAKYLVTDLGQKSNYVKFNNTLYRIVDIANTDDGYGNTELRTKIISTTSIGNNQFDTTTNNFANSSIKNTLNTTFYNNTLGDAAKEMIDTAQWTENAVEYVGLISASDYTNNTTWLTMEQFTLTASGTSQVKAVSSSGLVDSAVNVSKATYPVVYLKEDVLIIGGSGTQADPYLLELSGNGLQPNPTKIEGRSLVVTGSNQELVVVTDKVGTPYYSTSTQLTSSNFSTVGYSTIPVAKDADIYTIYYYIPAGETYKAKSGTVTTNIAGKTYTVNYVAGDNITSIGKTTDTCTTSGSSLTCSVTLPSITAASGFENGKWVDGSNQYNPGASYTLSSNGKTLTAQVSGKTYVATFVKNGATEIGSTSLSCTVSSGTTCTVQAPSITRSGYTILGWNTNANATTGTQVGNLITLSGNETYNAITRKTVTITFNKNGNTSQTVSGGSASTAQTVTQQCNMYNTQESCSVTSPTITMSGFAINGYSTGATTYSNYWAVNTSKSVSADATWFAQTTKASIPRSIIFYKNGNTAFTYNSTRYTDNSKSFTACTIPEVHNGATQNSSCTATITMPTIEAASGFTNVGWSTGANTHTATYTSGQSNVSITFDSNKSYYAQSTKAQVNRTITFYKNGNTAFTYNNTRYTDTSKSFMVCTIAAVYNGDTQGTSCTGTITMPTIEAASGFTNIGWSTGADTHTATYTSGQSNVSLTMDSNKSYYAQSSKAAVNRTITFYKNGNTAFTYNSTRYTDTSKSFTVCTIPAVYNGATQNSSCTGTITMPTIEAASGFTNIGWSTGANTHTATYTSGQSNVSITFDSNKSYYAQSSKAAVNRTITFYKNGNTAFSYNSTRYTDNSKSFTACTIPAVYNGATQNSSCTGTITMPTIEPASGFTNIGWSTGTNTHTATYTSGQSNVSITFDSNKSYYAQSTKATRTITITFNKNGNPSQTPKNGTAVTANTLTQSCNIDATYNGTAQATACSITSPTINTPTGFTALGYSDSNNSQTITWNQNTEANVSADKTYYAQSSKGLTATFYYNSNTTNGSLTVATKTASCTLHNNETECTVTVPSEVSSSVGKYNGTYKGVTTSTSSMGSTSLTISDNTTYYANYSKAVTIYRPTSESAAGGTTVYRNEYFTSTSAMGATVSSANNNTTTITSISGLWSGVTFAGYSTSVNTGTVTSGLTTIADSIATRTENTYYVIGTYTKSVTGTFYYSNSAAGAKTSTTGTGTQTRNIYCSSTTAATTNVKSEGNYTIPTLTGETAPTGTASVGWAINNASSMSTGTPTTANTKFYKVYRNQLTIYRPTSASAAGSTTAYRNAYYGTGTNYTVRISTSNTGTSDMTSIAGLWSSATFVGYSTSANTSTVTSGLTTVAASIKSHSSTTYYVIGSYTTSVTGTFYYSNSASGGKTSTTGTGTQTRNVYCSSTSAATTSVKSEGNYTIPTLTGETAPTGTTSEGWAINNASSMSTGTPTTANTSFYKVYRNQLTIYRPTSASAASATTAYRNAYYGTGTNYTVKVATSNTGTSDMTSVSGLWSSATFVGYSTSVNTATVTSGLTTVADSIRAHGSTTYYVIGSYTTSVTGTFYYSNSTSGGKTSTTGTGTQTRNVYCSSTSAATTSVKSEGNYTIPTLTGETAPTGTTSVGWATSASSMSTTTPTTANTAFYKVYRNQLTIYRPTSASAASSTTAYRNAYYGTGTNYTVRISTSNTGTSDMTSVSGLWSSATFVGYSTSSNTSTVTSGLTTVAASIKPHASTTYYVIGEYSSSVDATFYYSKDASGTVGSATASANQTRNVYCSSNTAATTSLKSQGTLTAPTINDETAPTGTARVSGWATANSNMSTTTTLNTGTTKYYAVYRNTVSIIKPTNETQASTTTAYRNAYLNTASPTVGTTKYTAVIATANTGTSNMTSISGLWSSATFAGYSTSANTTTVTSGLTTVAASIASRSETTYYAIGSYTKSITGTFYYSNNSGGAKTSVTGTGTQTRNIYCSSATAAASNVKSEGNYTIPTLTSETYPDGTASVGWATSASSMSTTTPTTANTAFYKVYRNQLTIYRPSNTTTAGSTTAYRNAYYGTDTNYTIKIATSSTGTTDMTSVSGLMPGIGFAGYSTSVNTATVTSGLTTVASSIKNRSETTYYAIGSYGTLVTATFYYSNSTSGAKTSTTGTGSQSKKVYCTSTTTATSIVTGEGNYTIPTLTGETAPTGTTSVGWATSASSMSTTTPTTANTSFYKVYRNQLTIYRPTSASAAGSTTAYRNAYYGNGTYYSVNIATSNTGTTDMTGISGLWSSATFAGYSTSANTATVTSGLTTVANSIKARSETTYYVIGTYTTTVTATFYYSTSSDGTVGSVQASGTQTRNVFCTGTSASTTNVKTEGSITPSLNSAVNVGATTPSGWSTASSSMTATDYPTTANTKYYRVYRQNVSFYAPTSESACNSTTLYRNSFINTANPTVGTTKYTFVLSTTQTGNTSNATYTPSITGYTVDGYNTSNSVSTPSQTTLSGMASNTSWYIYAMLSKTENVTATFYYSTDESGTVGSATSNGTQKAHLICSSATVATKTYDNIEVTAPTITGEVAPSGTSSSPGFAVEHSNMTSYTGWSTKSNKFYRVYKFTVTMYKPTSTSACNSTNTVFYRNAFINTSSPTVGTTKYTKVLSTTNTGTTENASYTPNVSGYSLAGYATESNSNTITYTTIAQIRQSASQYVYAVLSKDESVSATFYYSTSATGTFGNVTGSGTKTTFLRCTNSSTAGTNISNGTITVPTLTGEVAPTGTTSVGWATSASSMSTVTPTTANTAYYKVYRSTLTIYRPTSASAASSTTAYRNAYYGTGTNYTVKVSTSNTGTSDMTSIAGLWSGTTFVGYSTSANTTTPTSGLTTIVDSIRAHSSTTYYVIGTYTTSVTGTFYYSNSTAGAKTSVTGTGNRVNYVYCSSNSAATTALKNEANYTIPTLTGETAPTGTASVGWAINNASSMSTGTPTTANTAFYKVYRNTLTIYRPTSASAASSTTAYRNAYYGTDTNYTVKIATSNTGTSDMTSIAGLWSSATFAGYSTSANTATVTSGLTSVAASIKSHSSTTYYVIGSYTETITGTFYYSNSAAGAKTSTTGTGTRTNNVYCSSTSAATTSVKSEGNYTIPTLTGETAPTGTASVGWAINNASTMSTGTPTTANTSFYKVYRNTLTIYRPTSASAAGSVNAYRNAYYGTGTNYTVKVATSNTGTSDMTSVSGLWSSATFVGYSTSVNTTTVTSGLTTVAASIRAHSSTTYYVIGSYTTSVTGTFYYSNSTSGGKTSTTGTGTQTRNVYCSSTSAATTSVKSEGNYTIPTLTGETAPTGTSSIGWAINNASTMSTGTPTTANTKFYKVYRSTLTIYRPTSASAASSTTAYRNAYYGTGTSYTQNISTSNTGTSDMTSVSGLWSSLTFAGYSTSVNTATVTSGLTTVAASIKYKSNTTYYTIGTTSENATFKYNSNGTCGSVTISSATSSTTATYYCSSTSAATVSHGTTSTVPSAVSSSKGQYNSAYKSIAAANSMSSVSSFTGGQTYYAVYSSSVTNYYYNSGYTSRTLYRNEYLASSTATSYTAVLSTSATGTSNYSTATGPGSSAWNGLSKDQNTSTEYTSVADAAKACETTLYTVYQFSVTYAKGANVSSIASTSGSCKVTTSSTSCNVTLPLITPNSGYVSVGWSTTNGATSGTDEGLSYSLSTSGQTLYANAKSGGVTITFNKNGGTSVNPTSRVVIAPKNYTNLPTPTRTGDFTFEGWYADLTSNGYVNYGRSYMYTDKISVHMRAYRDSWSGTYAIISCTESGGWEIYVDGGKIQGWMYDSGNNYKTITSNRSLSSGWHTIDLIFDGSKEYLYVDGNLDATSAAFSSGKIGYHSSNSLILGAEAGTGSTASGEYFNGYIADLVINHDSTRITTTSKTRFAAPAANMTLKAYWLGPIYHIVFDKRGGSGGTSEVYYRYNDHVGDCYYYTDASLTNCVSGSTITKPTKSGKVFDGYYTATAGGGTQYVDGCPTSSCSSGGTFRNNIYTKTPNEINSSYTDTITLYAGWGTAYSGDPYITDGGYYSPSNTYYTLNTYLRYSLVKGENTKIRGTATIHGTNGNGSTSSSYNAYIYGTFWVGSKEWYLGGLQTIYADWHTFTGTESSPFGTGSSITFGYTSDGGNAMNTNANRTINLN